MQNDRYAVYVATPEGGMEGHSAWPNLTWAIDKAEWISDRYGIFTSVTDLDTNEEVHRSQYSI